MTQSELKRLSRTELLEMLLESRKETEDLQARLAEAQAQLENRALEVQNAGTLADASIRLNRVMEAAQSAADQYLENVSQVCRKTEAECSAREAESIRRAEEIIAQAEQKAQRIEAEARRKADAYWEESNTRIQNLLNSHSYLKRMFRPAPPVKKKAEP